MDGSTILWENKEINRLKKIKKNMQNYHLYMAHMKSADLNSLGTKYF